MLGPHRWDLTDACCTARAKAPPASNPCGACCCAGPELLIEAMPEKVLSVVSPALLRLNQSACLCTYGAHNRYAVQLILRSINTARSAFVAITFRNETFDAFDVYETVIVQAGVLIKVNSAAIDGTFGVAFLTTL